MRGAHAAPPARMLRATGKAPRATLPEQEASPLACRHALSCLAPLLTSQRAGASSAPVAQTAIPPSLPVPSALQLLASPVQRRRITAMHSAVVGSLGYFQPADQLLGSPRVQCTAALNFALLFLGWALPAVLAARRTWLELEAAIRQQERQQRRQRRRERRRREEQDMGAHCNESSATISSSQSGSSSSSSSSRSEISVEAVGDWGDANQAAAPSAARTEREMRLRNAAAAQRLPGWAVWLIEEAFPPVRGLAAARASVYLPLLAAACWLAGCTLAVAAA